jgi:hypothetical protein
MTPTTPAPGRRAGAALVAVGGLSVAAVLLAVSGRTLPFPADLEPTRLAAWADAVGGPTVAFTVLRALAVALVVWCGVGWLLGVAARLGRRPGAVRLTDHLSIPLVRRLADAAAGLAVAGATLSPVAVAATPAPTTLTTPETAVVVMTDLGPAPSRSTTTTATSPETSSTTPLTVAPSPTVASSAIPTTSPPATAATDRAPATDGGRSRPGATAVGSTWVIAPGDTLWHVAETSAAEKVGRAPSPAEIVEQLDRVIAANLDRLVIPGDPDLVFPGQEFVVP